MFGLNRTADVYTPHATTGAYTVLAKSGLRCRLAVQTRGANLDPASERDEDVRGRRLLWDEAYTMPSNAQVEIDSTRWNVVPGTIEAMTGLGSTAYYRRCDVIEAVE